MLCNLESRCKTEIEFVIIKSTKEILQASIFIDAEVIFVSELESFEKIGSGKTIKMRKLQA